MFYSEQLLSKTGPLARVWLASNVERKLSKSQILSQDIPSSVGAIVDQGQAPMALRLSGQLMLGVVRIYGRKARYLLDDCNEALLKIRMTFKSTNNHDLPAHTVAIDLNLPEALTIDDLFPAMDFGFPLTGQPAIEDAERGDPDRDWTTTLQPFSSTQSRLSPDDEPLLQEDDLGLDLGEDVGMDTTISIQMGRNAPTPRPIGEDLFEEGIVAGNEDIGLDLGEDVPMGDAPPPPPEAGLDVGPADFDLAPLNFGEDETLQLRQAQEAGRTRTTESPLSEADPELLRDLDRTFTAEEEVEEVVAQQRQRNRKGKPLVADVETVLHNSQIKAQSEDRSKILKPASFLPRDPVLLTLMNMQKNGDFVTNGMLDGRSRDWAPELQGLLSFEVVHRSGQLKRKRDSGIALSDDERSDKSPRLELEDDSSLQRDEGVDVGGFGGLEAQDEGLLPDIANDPALEEVVLEEEDEGIFADDTFDNTTMPLVHPADSGPISVGTKHAVHLLREQFGGLQLEGSPSSQTRKAVQLQDLLPEGQTTREDATKMFFEVLVLATKDAIKVEQGDKSIGMPLRIRAKRGLWGNWAEHSPADDPNADTQGAIGTQPSAITA